MVSVEETRLHDRTYHPRPAGRSFYVVTCPFCDCETEARAWSLAGSGKRCGGDCGAIHHWYGTTKGPSR